MSACGDCGGGGGDDDDDDDDDDEDEDCFFSFLLSLLLLLLLSIYLFIILNYIILYYNSHKNSIQNYPPTPSITSTFHTSHPTSTHHSKTSGKNTASRCTSRN